MSVLDDAIREHLELRRRNGASEQEIAVKEAEALGPVGHAPDVAAEASALEREQASEPSARDEPVAEAPAEPSLRDEAGAGAPPVPDEIESDADLDPSEDRADAAQDLRDGRAGADLELSDERPDADQDLSDEQAGTDLELADERLDIDMPEAIEEEEHEEEQREAADEPLTPERPLWRAFEPPPRAPAAERVRRPDASAPASSEPPADPADDVLEETPDFLQETPEHERLWFEQRPPRDFDFDD